MKELSNNIEAIYPLAPMQQGLLFHTLMNPGQGMYLLQYRHVMEMDNLDTDAFQRAWNAVVQRHELLRTAFVWKQQKRPLQVVFKQLDLPVAELDWRGLDAATQQQQLEAMLAEERREELAFNKAPLMRVRLIRLGENRYQFVRSYHHILMDAWCFSLIMMDFLACYRAFSQGKSLSLEKPRQYRDFINWLQAQPADGHRDFWQQRLAGFDTPTPLGIRQPQQFADAEPVVDVVEQLSVADTARLQQLAAQNQVTLNTLVQGAWALLLNRYSGEQDLLFGVTVAGRPAHMNGMESVVGLFINTLPLRWQVKPTARLGEWLRELQRENLALREHETSSLADIQQWSEVEGQDLFQSLFVFENAPMDAGLSQENLEFIVQDATNRTHTNYPITVVIIPGEQLHLQLTYQGSDFCHSAVETMLGHFRTLLLAMAGQAADVRLDSLPMISTTELIQQQQWGQGDALPLGADYITRFEAQVAANPDRTAVRGSDMELSFKELNQRANSLSQLLIRQGVGVDSIVALLGERNAELLVMILAVLKAGGAYLPLDPKQPPLRLAQVLKQSRSPLLLAIPSTQQLAQQAIDVLDAGTALPDLFPFDLVGQVLDSASAENPSVPTSPENLGYVIFTSGSTGTPKGAMVTRQGMLNNMLGKFAPLQLGTEDVIAQTASQCFDISVWQFLIAPILGARVEILPDCVSQDPARLVQEIEQRGITILEPVPALLQGMLLQDQPLDSLKWVLPTGEALPPVVAQQWSERYPAIPLMNAYGPAECSDDVAFHPITERLDDSVRHVPIGRATANNRLYLLSPELEPMPVGAIGEIYVAGTGVGRGYLNEPERTAGVFLPNPFNDSPDSEGSRLYRTGDLARLLPDGSLQYVGRVDYQVKVRGYRIELGEIESRLGQHPLIDEVVLIAADDSQRGKMLVAYIAGSDAESLAEGGSWRGLRDFVAEGLPDYMVPAAFVAMTKLPRNNNGKVDRKQLPELDFNRQREASYVAPQNELQQQLAETWQSLLGLERVGISDNFFELGGHSLLATQLVGQLSRLLGYEVPLRSLFEQPTIELLADWLDQNQDVAALPALTPAGRDVLMPLSWSQQRMWFLQQLEPQSAAYNLPAALRIRGQLDARLMQQALNQLLSRHEVLRTRFVVEQGEPRQLIEYSLKLVLQQQDLRAEADVDAALNRALRADAMQPFKLEQAPLLRVSLYQLEDSQVLAFNCHHIIADAWSLRLLIDQFCQDYRALVDDAQAAGSDIAAAAAELQYADYAIWQQQLMRDGLLDTQLEYWRSLLQPEGQAELPLLELSTDYPRPTQPSGAGQRLVSELPAALAQQLIAADRSAGRSHFTTTMAAFQLLLGAYSGQQDILIGVPVANRHHAATQPMLGCFINTLVHRADLQPQQSVEQLLAAIADQALQAQANQDLPFDYLIDQLGVDRQLSYNPLFQAMFNFLSGTALEQLDIAGIEAEAIDNRPDTALCDFKLDLQAHDGGFILSFEYSSELFAPETVARMAADYQRILAWLLDNPAAHLAEMNLWQPTEVAVAVEPLQDLLAQFAGQVQAAPEALALQGATGSLSYAELDQRSDRLAAALQQQGVTLGARVALCVERDGAMLISMLAVLKCGAAYVPLEPAWPVERAGYILEHSRPSLCLVDDALRGQIEQWQPGLACLSPQATADQPLQPVALKQNQLAYILYTSGSTGRPKGVEISRDNIAHLCRALATEFPLQQRDQVLALTTYCFDISVLELLYPLTRGASILIADKQQVRDPQQLALLLDQNPVSLMQATPATWSMLLAQTPRRFDGITAIAGGEALSAGLAGQLLARGVDLTNAYGPTEATVWASFQRLQPGDCQHDGNAVMPIGRAIEGLQAYVLDSALRPVPTGVVGELYLSGDGVGLGYHRAPELTAAAFLLSPFGPDGERLYKTGDLVRRRADGVLDYIGRNDFQVKLRGFRIELGEIEALLPQLDGVDNAAVLLQGSGDKARLVTYWSGSKQDSDLLRQHLAVHLPEYMLPSAWQWLAELPQNANGKVDRKALPALLEEQQGTVSSGSAPQGHWEQLLAGYWQQLLQQPQVSREDNFFNLGGHSLLAARLVATLAEEQGIELPLRSLFEKPQLSELAAELENLAEQGSNSLRIQACGREGLLPMHATQKRLWFLEQFNGASRAYQLTLALRIKGTLEQSALELALLQLIERQHSLRTLFTEHQGELYQQVLPKIPLPLQVHPVSAELLAEGAEEALEAQLRQLADQPFEPQTSAPWRINLLQPEQVAEGEGTEQVLQLCMHHLIADGWSLQLFFEELQALYLAVLDQRSAELSELPYQFVDYAYWWQGEEAAELLQQQLTYWTGKLAGEQPLLDLPTDLPRPKQLGNRGQRHRFELPATLVSQLQQRSAEQSVTAFVPLLNAWQLLLSRYSGQQDIRVGIPVANRHQAHSGKLIGFFASTQVVKAPLAPQLAVSDSWQALQQTLNEAQQHQDLPFEQLVDALQLPRDNGRAPLFQSLFNLIQLDSGNAFAGLETRRINLEEGTALSEIGLQIEQGADQWHCVLEYSSELFLPATAARYARHYLQLLEAMLAGPQLRLCQLQMLESSDFEREIAFNATDAELDPGLDLIRRFEAQAERTPDAEALRFHDQSLSYRELNRQANQLAHQLIGRGIAAEQPVAVLLERGPQLLLAQLAVLKAGAAYIPLDPAQPAERLGYICQHAQPALLLTQTEFSGLLSCSAEALLLDQPPLERPPEHNPQRAVDSAQLAYVIYTSGSTGKPKGVAVSRGNLANFLYAMDREVTLTSADRWLAVTTSSFDISALELYLPLLQGAAVLIADRRQAIDADALFELLQQATVFQATPASWQLLLTKNASQWPNIRGLIGGEAVPASLAAQLLEKGVALTNVYGPTETTIWSTSQPLDATEVAAEGVAAIGQPLLNNRCYLLDEQLQPVPPGATGELYIAGEGVARGYQNAPELTAAAFLPNPFSNDGSRFYKTGDLVRRRADGALQYIGRSDFQVKVRGFRIELGEIESCLRRFEGVSEAVVVADSQQRLLGYLQASGDIQAADLDRGAIRQQLEQQLPAYMVPYQLVCVDSFGLNSNGKIDRKALPTELDGAELPQDQGRAPEGDVELRLAAIWQQLLAVEPGAEQSFFELGGHSLLAMQMISKVEAEFGLRLALQALFERPTIAALAEQVSPQADQQQDDELDFMDQLLSEFED